MKRLSKVNKAPRLRKAFAGFLLAGLLLLGAVKNVGAVRLSGEEIEVPPSGKPAPSPESPETGPAPKQEAVKPTPVPPAPPRAEPPVEQAARPTPPKTAAPPARLPAPEQTPEPAARNEEPAKPQPAPVPRQETEKRYVTIDFDNVDILLFVKFISEVTGKNFVIDEKVKGKVTIISPTKISVDEAFQVFESVLEVHGFTTIPSGNIIKIVPSIDARGKSIETRLREEAEHPEDKVVTQLIRLDYANPDELKKLFAPLISKTSVIVSYPPTGMLIVTDVLSNINRLMRIIKAVDVPGIGEELSVIPLEHASAAVMSKPLIQVFQPPTRTATAAKGRQAAVVEGRVQIVADERTNSLIVLASEHDTVRVKQLIKLLDQETPRGAGDIRVHYLQYANAEELSAVLTALPKEAPKADEKGKTVKPVISKEVQIVADKSTNSLVITANKQDFQTLVDVIAKLDIPRPMVYIEALIMEVRTDKNFSIGVEWQVGDAPWSYKGSTVGYVGTSGAGSSLIGSTAASLAQGSVPAGLTLGVVGQAIEINGLTLPSIGAVVQAFQNDADVHILQTPQILTTDNQEAQIQVADNVPYLTKEATGEQTYQTYEYRDVGVTLKITPQINQERFVRLKIFQEYITLAAQQGAEFRPTTLKRTADTAVIVKDGHTVVIGGLVGEKIDRGTTALPCLGNIPLLGWLFKSYSNRSERTNLYVFLTPHIIENTAEADGIYKEKSEDIGKLEEGVIKMYERLGTPFTEPESPETLPAEALPDQDGGGSSSEEDGEEEGEEMPAAPPMIEEETGDQPPQEPMPEP